MIKDKNKRRTQRHACLVPVEGKEGGIFELSRTVDISKTGIGFISQKKVPLNKKIAIELDLAEEDEPVLVVGKVKWVHPIAKTGSYRIGMTFSNVKDSFKPRLSKYLK